MVDKENTLAITRG